MEKKWFEFLKDKDGNLNARELTVILCLFAFMASWIGQQFLGKPIPEWMYYGNITLITGGVFGYSIEKRSKMLDIPQEGPVNTNS